MDVEKTVTKGDRQFLVKQDIRADLLLGGEQKVLEGIRISFPIMHHVHQREKMTVVKTEKDKQKGREMLHEVSTILIPLYYDMEQNRTTCCALIHQGIRHQIRIHAASI